jgi:starch phosphorylase
MPGTAYQLEVNPQLPERLIRLGELANNLWYSWDRPTRTLFSRLHPALWHAVGHSPKAFLKRIDQQRLIDAADDPVFLSNYNRVLSAFDSYLGETRRSEHAEELAQGDLIAYFCAEFGFHESLPIYSGGLGILAGDHFKAASDLALPFVGVGLLYRQGYFSQTIDNEGRQHALYTDADFDDLPITPVPRIEADNSALEAEPIAPVPRDDGGELHVTVELPGRSVAVKVWQAQVGKVRLFLLDTDIEKNSAADRYIAHRLYGGDRGTRIEQEIVLGVGGVRALNEMHLAPTVWHINEGHAAFLVLERMRQLTLLGHGFADALEAIAASTVFTTHTAVPAGHDHFSEEMIRRYFEGWCRDLKINCNELIALGRDPDGAEFNMTALAVRGSRFQNGVSRIHGGVSSRICARLWPQIEHADNPLTYVTNGVHMSTFLSDEWHELFDRQLGPGWSQRLADAECQRGIYAIPDHLFWAVHQSLKAQMLFLIRFRIRQQHARNQGSEAHLDRTLKLADPANPNVLTIGFARRFATYKRATLLFENLNWLREIVSDEKRPVLFLFAGKAHPADQPGQDFLRRIAEVARLPEFESHILLVEGYDLQLARRLVSGVDVWLNNPVYPLEACGTSGIKAGMNGVLNLSVLDGWWGEGYDGRNGWAIKPASATLDEARRNQEEARTLYEILQDSVLPLYYNIGPAGNSPGWVAMAKHSIVSILPRFNSTRMVGEYLTKFYQPAAQQWHRYAQSNFAGARAVASWKAKVRAAWSKITLRRIDGAHRRIPFGEQLRLEVAVNLNGLTPNDVLVELLFGRPSDGGQPQQARSYRFKDEGQIPGASEHLYALEFKPELCGQIEYRIRVYPYHELLTHRFEMGMMTWL